MKCKHSAEKCGIIAAVCYKEKQRISRDKTHETDHTTQEDKTMAKIYVFLADGCEEIEALTPVDLLRRAGEDVCTVSIMGRKEVTGSHKITILADETIEEGEFDDGDMLVLPGGMPGTLNLAGNETLAALIRSYDDQEKKLAAICAAPTNRNIEKKEHHSVLYQNNPRLHIGKTPENFPSPHTTPAYYCLHL